SRIAAVPKAPDIFTEPPVRTFQVKPPASFTGDQLPDSGSVEFQVAGTAGQILHVKLSDGWAPYVLVQTPVTADRLIPGGDNLGNRLFALPLTGTYRVVAERVASQNKPPGGQSGIQMALLTIENPMVDPGIRPEQISIDLGLFAKAGQFELVPYSHFEGD